MVTLSQCKTILHLEKVLENLSVHFKFKIEKIKKITPFERIWIKNSKFWLCQSKQVLGLTLTVDLDKWIKTKSEFTRSQRRIQNILVFCYIIGLIYFLWCGMYQLTKSIHSFFTNQGQVEFIFNLPDGTSWFEN